MGEPTEQSETTSCRVPKLVEGKTYELGGRLFKFSTGEGAIQIHNKTQKYSAYLRIAVVEVDAVKIQTPCGPDCGCEEEKIAPTKVKTVDPEKDLMKRFRAAKRVSKFYLGMEKELMHGLGSYIVGDEGNRIDYAELLKVYTGEVGGQFPWTPPHKDYRLPKTEAEFEAEHEAAFAEFSKVLKEGKALGILTDAPREKSKTHVADDSWTGRTACGMDNDDERLVIVDSNPTCKKCQASPQEEPTKTTAPAKVTSDNYDRLILQRDFFDNEEKAAQARAKSVKTRLTHKLSPDKTRLTYCSLTSIRGIELSDKPTCKKCAAGLAKTVKQQYAEALKLKIHCPRCGVDFKSVEEFISHETRCLRPKKEEQTAQTAPVKKHKPRVYKTDKNYLADVKAAEEEFNARRQKEWEEATERCPHEGSRRLDDCLVCYPADDQPAWCACGHPDALESWNTEDDGDGCPKWCASLRCWGKAWYKRKFPRIKDFPWESPTVTPQVAAPLIHDDQTEELSEPAKALAATVDGADVPTICEKE
jgi:hypothetical protein